MTRIALLISLLVLSACNSLIPTSSLLEYIRGTRQPILAREMKTQHVRLGSPVFLRVFKQENVLEAWLQDPESERYILYKTYPICRFSGGLGPKQAEGDKQAPEGFYLVGPGQMNPKSQFHLAFNLGYPNAYDRARGRTGSALMIHGGCQSTGCFAMTDEAIEEVYLLLDNAMRKGQEYVPVHIFPFRMTVENLEKHRQSEWFDFWQNMKEGYDSFENTKTPPMIGLNGADYAFYDRAMIATAIAAQTVMPAAGTETLVIRPEAGL